MIADIAKCVSMEGVVIQAAAFPVTSKSTMSKAFRGCAFLPRPYAELVALLNGMSQCAMVG